MEMALRDMGFDTSMLAALHEMLDFIDDAGEKSHHPSRAYIREQKDMKLTPADVVDYLNAYRFIIDMPGLKPDQIKVHLEEGNTLVVSAERRREKEKEGGVKYVRMERRFGKLLKKFVLPENADSERVSAVCENGVLTVSVEKKPVPEKKKRAVDIEVKSESEGGGGGGGRREVDTRSGAPETEGSHGEDFPSA